MANKIVTPADLFESVILVNKDNSEEIAEFECYLISVFGADVKKKYINIGKIGFDFTKAIQGDRGECAKLRNEIEAVDSAYQDITILLCFNGDPVTAVDFNLDIWKL